MALNEGSLRRTDGATDFDKYRIEPAQPLTPDLFVPDNVPPPPGVSLKAKA
jgi:citronellol/citronellal dehydrogenase